MELAQYLRILKRRKWVVISTVLTTMLVVILATWLMSPSYKATATIRINTASAGSNSYNDYIYADRLITTYINIAQSTPIIDELNKKLELSKDLSIEIKQIPSSELIEISVEDQDPNLALNAANTLGEILVAQGSTYYSSSGTTPAEVLKVQIDEASAELDQLRRDYYNRVEKYPDDVEGNQVASKAVDLQQSLYYSLLSQYQTLKAREALQSNIVSIIEMAELPATPSKPNKVLNIALGLIVGAIGGLGLGFLFENLDSTLYTAKDLNQTTNLRFIGQIPVVTKKEQRIPPLEENSILEEAISHLKTNLLSYIQESSARTLLVASSIQNEGKTLVVSNLAFSLAQSGKKVILIDCDLRVPSVYKHFNLKNEVGLGDFLADKTSLGKIIKSFNSSHLKLITGGKVIKQPAILLDTPRMRELISKLLEDYDIVILDAPAVLAVADASILAPLADGVLLVTRLGLTKREKLLAAIDQLANVKAKLIGLIINGGESSHYYHYYSQKPSSWKVRGKNGARI